MSFIRDNKVFPALGAGTPGKFLRTDASNNFVWDGVNTALAVAMVANAGAITIEDSGDYQFDISGVLTAPATLTATLLIPAQATKVVFDNFTTGGFPITLNGTWIIPPGRSSWYWNGVAFEEITTSFVTMPIAMVANAAQFTFPNYRSTLCDISGALTAAGNITATMPANAGLMVFDNVTTGGFALQVNATYTIPPGRTVWYWNGATLEKVSANGFTTAQVTPLPAAGVGYTINHLCGAVPSIAWLELVCLVGEQNYVAGDVVQDMGVWAGAVPIGLIMPIKNSTVVMVAMVAGQTVCLPNKTTGVVFTPTAANWAWRFNIQP